MFTQRRRKEREELWVEYAYEEKEDIAEQKAEEERRQQQAHREKLKKTVEEQLEELEKRKIKQKEERQFEQLLVISLHFVAYYLFPQFEPSLHQRRWNKQLWPKEPKKQRPPKGKKAELCFGGNRNPCWKSIARDAKFNERKKKRRDGKTRHAKLWKIGPSPKKGAESWNNTLHCSWAFYPQEYSAIWMNSSPFLVTFKLSLKDNSVPKTILIFGDLNSAHYSQLLIILISNSSNNVYPKYSLDAPLMHVSNTSSCQFQMIYDSAFLYFNTLIQQLCTLPTDTVAVN